MYSILRNMKNFMKTKVNQFTQLWARKVYNFKRSKIFFAKCLQE